jgi:hypothetical protein
MVGKWTAPGCQYLEALGKTVKKEGAAASQIGQAQDLISNLERHKPSTIQRSTQKNLVPWCHFINQKKRGDLHTHLWILTLTVCRESKIWSWRELVCHITRH